jgi:hypothetical protein
VVLHRARLLTQDAPTSLEDMMLGFGRHHRCFPYRDGHNTPEDTLACVEALADAGAHAAILRFVAEQDVSAVRTILDRSMHPLDMTS